MKKFRVIVPSWSPLTVEMQAETGCQYPAFISLGGEPLYAHILHSYEAIRNEAEFVVILPEEAPSLNTNLFKDYDVSTLRISSSSSIGDTVSAAMHDLTPKQSVVVHMADTLISSHDFNYADDVLYVELRSDLYRWTSVHKDINGVIKILKDRDQSGSSHEQMVFVGVFIFSEGLLWRDQLSEALLAHNPETEVDPFFSAIEAYSKIQDVQLKRPEFWYDCGHVDSFYESRLNYQNLRHFNSLTYDSERAIVTKRSHHLEAFRHQVRWFRQVPDELSSFLPRIYDSSDGASPFISMELLSIPSLSEVFVSGRLQLGAWNDVARKVNSIQLMLHKYAFSSTIAQQIAADVYITKTLKRIVEFCKQRPDACKIWVDVLGKKFSLEDVIQTIESYVKKSKLLDIEFLTPIHGDMCFSNIMYDPRGKNIKLIDPRGEFGIPGIYGDPRYDKSKLRHSYSGGYDFIVSDLFEVSLSANGLLNCNINRNDYHAMVNQIFDAIIFHDDEEQRQQCDAIQALLFLGMLPLHIDKPDRQLAMLYVGLTKYVNNL